MVISQSNRPDFYAGRIIFAGTEYDFISGGEYKSSSMPYGVYGPLTFAPHDGLRKRGAVHIADELFDPKFNEMRNAGGFGFGLDEHVIGAIGTAGCLAVHRHQWPTLREQLNAALVQRTLIIRVTPEEVVITDGTQ